MPASASFDSWVRRVNPILSECVLQEQRPKEGDLSGQPVEVHLGPHFTSHACDPPTPPSQPQARWEDWAPPRQAQPVPCSPSPAPRAPLPLTAPPAPPPRMLPRGLWLGFSGLTVNFLLHTHPSHICVSPHALTQMAGSFSSSLLESTPVDSEPHGQPC